MTRTALATACSLALVVATATTAVKADDLAASLKPGKPDLKSAGPLAFGPDGILFIGDTQGAAVFAVATGDKEAAKERPALSIKNLTQKVAARLGTDPQKVMVNDVAINPTSGKAYFAVSRGRGPDAVPVILRAGADGKLEEVSLDNVKFAKAEVPNAPAPGKMDRGQDQRSQSITDLAYLDGKLFLAGLSNEEFSSRLISIPFPFSGPADGSAIEIYHGAHGRFETKSPVRTFVTYKIADKPYLLAAYTCTPLVKVPVADLKPGAHVKGTTIAELGNRNRPLDMITYSKEGKDFLLLANSDRGVMKIPTEGAGTAEAITSHVKETKGIKYETVEKLKGVLQLDKLDDSHAVVLVRDDAGAEPRDRHAAVT
ncbi:MAG: hypothetical protein U0794_03770 [Isosphaeraceae bacterium]